MNTAVKYAAPARREQEQVQSEKEYLAETLRKRESRVLEKKAERREFSPAQAAVLAVSLLMLLGMLAFYIMQLSNHYSLKSSISSLQLEYEETVQSNALMKDEIEQNLNLTEIYAYATEILGMQVPEKHQIVYYEQPDSEYVKVDGAIPNE